MSENPPAPARPSGLKRFGILPWVLLAIILGLICGGFMPEPLARVFYTFNDIFSQLLNFAIPLIIIGLVVGVGAGDNAGAALGLGSAPGETVVSIGTSGTAFAVSPTPVADPSGTVAGFCDAAGAFLPLVATLNAAQHFGLERELGSITPGRRADLGPLAGHHAARRGDGLRLHRRLLGQALGTQRTLLEADQVRSGNHFAVAAGLAGDRLVRCGGRRLKLLPARSQGESEGGGEQGARVLHGASGEKGKRATAYPRWAGDDFLSGPENRHRIELGRNPNVPLMFHPPGSLDNF